MDAPNRDDRNPDPTTAYRPAAEQPGMTIAGRYKPLEAIGEGGMGMVWVARPTSAFSGAESQAGEDPTHGYRRSLVRGSVRY